MLTRKRSTRFSASDHIIPREEQLTLEARMDDIRAVIDVVGSGRATLLGFGEGFALCAIFAATYPERVATLIALAPTGRQLAYGMPRTVM